MKDSPQTHRSNHQYVLKRVVERVAAMRSKTRYGPNCLVRCLAEEGIPSASTESTESCRKPGWYAIDAPDLSGLRNYCDLSGSLVVVLTR